MSKQTGYSLLEVLIVLAIMAAVTAAGYVSLRPLALRNQVGRASADLAAALQRARSYAQRHNVSTTWTRLDDDTYRLTLGGEVKEYDLPTGIAFAAPPAGSTITYTAPYGEIDAVAHLIAIEGYGQRGEVRVVGVTGKVIRGTVKEVP